jgi:hypothetical protein
MSPAVALPMRRMPAVISPSSASDRPKAVLLPRWTTAAFVLGCRVTMLPGLLARIFHRWDVF